MKKSLVIAVLLFSPGLCANAQVRSAGESAAVQQRLTIFFVALSELNIDKMKSCAATDMVLLENGAVWNIDSLINAITPLKNGHFERVNNLRFLQTAIAGNTAWVAYYNTADMRINGQSVNYQWVESAVLVKEGKEWKIKLLHSTTLKPKAEQSSSKTQPPYL